LNDPAFGVDTLVLVADREGIVVGYGEADLAAGTVERLFVRPAVMGTGVGSALLARLETAVADRGHRRVSLDAADNALPFYERHGYARTGRSDRRDCGDVTLTCIGLAKTFLALMSILGGWAGPAH
jgi:GNAT superfamily N-acetyltransferase